MAEVKEVVGTNLLVFTKFEPKYRVGDTVQLKSGGPTMTVVACDEREVHLKWFIENNLHGDIQPINAVKKVETNASL
jgi:uncharacterized protein YodC (DUF2158 family)